MKTLIKLLIVAAILNATARAAMAAWSYYQFKDAAHQTVLFGAEASLPQLHEQIMRRAAELEVPVEPQNVEVTRDGPRTLARAVYTHPIEVFPRYRYPFEFEFTVDALSIKQGSPEDLIR